jgi:hypothetical protein
MLGVLGGGQLGRMFVHAAQRARLPRRGARTRRRQPRRRGGRPAPGRRLHRPRRAGAALRTICAAVTTEFENVPADALRALADSLPVSPPAAAVQVCQHRALRKAPSCRPACPVRRMPWSSRRPTPPRRPHCRAAARHPEDLAAGLRRQGPGPRERAADLAAAWSALGSVPCVLEQRLPLRHEISVIVARGRDGPGGAPAGAAEPAPRRHPGGDASAGARHRRVHGRAGRGAGHADRLAGRWAMWACCAWSSSCWPTVRWWPTRWRRGRTTRATTASTPATCRSSTCRCARWPACRWCGRACIRRP